MKVACQRPDLSSLMVPCAVLVRKISPWLCSFDKQGWSCHTHTEISQRLDTWRKYHYAINKTRCTTEMHLILCVISLSGQRTILIRSFQFEIDLAPFANCIDPERWLHDWNRYGRGIVIASDVVLIVILGNILRRVRLFALLIVTPNKPQPLGRRLGTGPRCGSAAVSVDVNSPSLWRRVPALHSGHFAG